MKKHLLHFWTLALLVMFGGSAWAENHFSQDYEGDGVTADWTTATSGRFNPVILEEGGNHFLSVAQDTRNNNGTTITSTSTQGIIQAGTDFTMTFDMRLSSSTNQTATEFLIYDAANTGVILALKETGTWATTWTINGTSDQVTLPNSNKGGGSNTIADVTWCSYKISRSGSITYLTITNKETSEAILERTIINGASEDGGIGKMAFVSSRYLANFAIDNIVIRDLEEGDVPTATPTTYTVKFVDGQGGTIKEDAIINTIAGIEVSASSELTSAFYANDKKYIYVSGNNAITTVEDGSANIITLVFREAETWSYTLNAVNGENILTQLKEGTAFEQDKLTIGYPQYINVDSTLWSRAASNKEFRTSFTLTSNNQAANLDYAITDIKRVIFLKEGEDIEGVSKFITGNSEIRSSNAGSGYSAEDITVTKLAVGKYKINVVACVATGTSNFSFKLGNREVCALSSGANNWASSESTFVVAKESNLTFVGGNANQGIDYIYIQLLGEPTAEELADAQTADEDADAAVALAAAKSALAASIEASKTIETEGKNGAEELATAISTAETALAAENATVETLGAAKSTLEQAVTDFKMKNLATAIVNADFTADEPIAQKVCTYAKDVQEGQVAQMQPLTGWTIVENGDARAAGTFAYGSTAILGGDGGNVPAVGPNGETEGKLLGIEAVWSATTQYTQEITLPAGDYLFEAVIYNAAGTGALSQNLIGIDGTYCTTKNYPVGKWTKDQVKITLAEEKTVTVSLGVNSGNVGNGAAPHLFIDHVKLYGSEEIAAIELAAAKENALAEVDALTIGDVLFTYPEAAISSAKAAIESATTVEAVDAAVVTAKAAQSKPAADKAYAIANTTATGNLCITTEKVSVAKDASVFFTEVEGGYVLSNEAGEYILKTAGNTWTLSTTTNKEEAYVVNFNLADGAYTIQGANGLFGLDSTDEGSTVYANKAQSNNGLWTIAEYVAPVVEPEDVTNLIVNPAYLAQNEAGNAASYEGWTYTDNGWKPRNYEAPMNLITYNGNCEFHVSQAIANVPAGLYKLTVNAFYRAGSLDDERAKVAAGTELEKALAFYATTSEENTYTKKVMNISEGAADAQVDGNGLEFSEGKYVPDGASDSRIWYIAGKYTNELLFNVFADGATVTIGLDKEVGLPSDYCPIGAWKLYRLGDADAEAATPDAKPEPTPEPIEGIIYSWESPEGTPVEFGGTIAYVNGDGDRLNYKNGDYYTICLNGKKADINAETASANAGKMVITLDEALNSGDTIVYTAYINKNTSATAAAYILFENGAEANGADFSDAANINEAFGGTPQNDTIIVSEAAAGSKTITLTRGKTGTNLFITKLQIIEKKAEPEPEPVDPIDYTSKIVNPSFEDGTTGWTYEPSNDHGAKENSNGTYTMTGCDGNYIFNIWSSGNAISQKVEGLPNGTYKLKAVIATDGGHKVQLNANGKSVQIDAVDKGTGVEGELEFNVLDGTATIGAEGVDKYWYKVDNFRLYFIKGFDIDELVTAYETALADAKTVEGNMNAEVKTALEAAIAAEVDKTNAEALGTTTATLVNATADAKASVAAYANAATILPKMKELTESTNVYTAEAYEQYYNQWVVKYEAATLTTAEANALQNPFLVTGWRASITCDNFLLSAWDTNPDFQDAPYYINSWSVEGENDGSNFKVPFFEYWTGDGDSLGERVLTATMNGLEAGDYNVTAWVRVRMKNGAEAPAFGITLQVNEGEAVDVAAGDQVGESQFYLKEFTATGTVAEDGVLKIKFNVAADNNISWLSFKNVKFEKHITVNPDDPEIEVAEGWRSIISNGNLASDEVANFFIKENAGDPVPAVIVPGAGKNNSRGIVINTPDNPSEDWDAQFFIQANENIPAGYKIHVEFDYKASQEAAFDTQSHAEPGNYIHWYCVDSYTATTEWQHMSKEVEVSAATKDEAGNWNGEWGKACDASEGGKPFKTIAFNLSKVKTATTFYFDNITFWVSKVSTGITDVKNEKKAETIYNLRGQKVNKADKGLFIINGKKVVK